MRDSTGSPKEYLAAETPLADETKGQDFPGAVVIDKSVFHDIPEEQEINVAAIIKGTVAGKLNLFEKKAALINAEIDKMGMGRYQICIWFLTGFGYFLDLGWSRTMGLTSTAIYQEMGIPNSRTGLIFTLANVGLAIGYLLCGAQLMTRTGALGFGIIVDIIGRKWAFNITCLITSVIGLLMAAPKYNYEAICAIYLFASIGLGGNIPIDALIALEFLPQKRRNLVSLLSMWQPIGVICACAIAFGTTAKYRCTAGLPSCIAVADGVDCCRVEDNMGWRFNIIIMGLLTLVIFFLRYLVFTFHESPKFLLSRGREQEAIDVLHKIAAFNKQPPPTLTVQHFREIEQAETTLSGTTLSTEMDPVEGEITAAQHAKMVTKRALTSITHLKSLFTNKLQLFIFILFAITYMGDYWSFNLAGSFLPIVLLQNNVSTGRGTVVETYRQYIYIALPGILGAALALLSVSLPLFGRKWSLVFSAAMQGLSMAMYTQVRTTVGYVGLNAMEYLMQTYFNAVLYASAPELFDTAYRGSASGMLSCLGRLSGIVAPFAGQYYLATNSSGILWLGAGGIWLAAVAMVFLPVEMRNRQMF